jgi:hypothetical protein
MRLPYACQASKYLQARRFSGAFTFLATLYKNQNGSFEVRCVHWREGTEPLPTKRSEYEGYADWEPIH